MDRVSLRDGGSRRWVDVGDVAGQRELAVTMEKEEGSSNACYGCDCVDCRWRYWLLATVDGATVVARVT
ncbi:hypothetical protein GW17_00059483, partial [Ensete ventricosum]